MVWHADGGLRDGHLVAGRLTGDGEDDLVCDLLGVDEAYPVPVTDDASRLRAHQAWRHGQVLLGQYDGRLTLAVPGTRFDAELVLDALAPAGARPSGLARTTTRPCCGSARTSRAGRGEALPVTGPSRR